MTVQNLKTVGHVKVGENWKQLNILGENKLWNIINKQQLLWVKFWYIYWKTKDYS